MSARTVQWAAVFLAIGLFAVAVFSNALGVDFETTSAVLVTGLCVIAVATLFAFMGMPPPWLMLLVVVGLWIAVWPALDVQSASMANGTISSKPWYGTSLAKWGIALVLALASVLAGRPRKPH